MDWHRQGALEPSLHLVQGRGANPISSIPHNSHVVCEGDVSTPCQQHADHLNVLVLRGPDDGRPSPTVLWVEREEGVGGSPCSAPAARPAHQNSTWSRVCALEPDSA